MTDRVARSRDQIDQLRSELMQERSSKQDLELDKNAMERHVHTHKSYLSLRSSLWNSICQNNIFAVCTVASLMKLRTQNLGEVQNITTLTLRLSVFWIVLTCSLSVSVPAAEGAAESCGWHGGPVSLLSRSLPAGEQDPGSGRAPTEWGKVQCNR